MSVSLELSIEELDAIKSMIEYYREVEGGYMEDDEIEMTDAILDNIDNELREYNRIVSDIKERLNK